MTTFINFSNGIISISTSRNNGVSCDDTEEFLDTVLSGSDATCSDYDLDTAIVALEDGEYLSNHNADQQTVEFLHAQLVELKRHA